MQFLIIAIIALIAIICIGCIVYALHKIRKNSTKADDMICYHVKTDCEECINALYCQYVDGPGLVEVQNDES